MKYLSDYTEDLQSKLFEDTGTFFAFNQEQFEEGCKKVGANKENKVSRFTNGGYVLSKNLEILITGLNTIHIQGIEADKKDNSIKDIIWRELGNYECQINGDYSRVIEVLEDYGITAEEIRKEYKEYFSYCVENDLF